MIEEIAYPVRSEISDPDISGYISLPDAKAELGLQSEDAFDDRLVGMVDAIRDHVQNHLRSPVTDDAEVSAWYPTLANIYDLPFPAKDTPTVTAIFSGEEASGFQAVTGGSPYLDKTGTSHRLVYFDPVNDRELPGRIAAPVKLSWNFDLGSVHGGENIFREAGLILLRALFIRSPDGGDVSQLKGDGAFLAVAKMLRPYQRTMV